jgi:CRISPR-associated protein Cst2
MSLHVFANTVTPFGTAANNRGETEGNTTTLQKLIWHGEPHTSVNAEAIRFALRRLLNHQEQKGTNRRWNDSIPANKWENPDFAAYADQNYCGYIDDDLLGYMSAEAAREEAGETRGRATVRRAVLEVTRALSLTPWPGDVVFNAASPGATPSAARGEGVNPVLYGAEVHATRCQFGLAMTPQRLRDPSRAAKALRCLAALGEVAGNHGRFLFDFSPDSIVIRLTDDPAPRLLYCFTTEDEARTVTVTEDFKKRVGKNRADIHGDELIIGGSFAATDPAQQLEQKGAKLFPHQVKAAVEEACRRIESHADVKGK